MKQKGKTKKKKSSFTIRIGQFIFLSFNCFNRNILWESASSCAFGFICSFIPIVFIIAAIVLGIVRSSPTAIGFIQDFMAEIAPMINFSRIQEAVLNKHVLSAMDLLLAFWLIWVSRKLSLSIIRSMSRIFGAESQRKNWWNQVLTFISEFVLVLMVATLILSTFIIRDALNLPIFESIKGYFPNLNRTSSKVIAQSLMYFIIFLCTVFSYKFLSGVKPPFSKCFFYAVLNTLFFYGLVKLFNLMVNRQNYNLVYGTISYVFILLIKIYFFFVLFLLFAQMIYVSEYFDQLLKSQIYFLPQDENPTFAQSFIRMLFINPSILKNDENTIHYNAGDTIFKKGQNVEAVFYLHKGIVSETKSDKSMVYHEAGSLMGTSLCILNEKYQSNAVALTECEIISFSCDEFMQIIQKDPRAATRAVFQVHDLTKELNYKKLLEQMDKNSN